MAPLAAHMQTAAPPRLPPACQGSVIACFVTSHVIRVITRRTCTLVHTHPLVWISQGRVNPEIMCTLDMMVVPSFVWFDGGVTFGWLL